MEKISTYAEIGPEDRALMDHWNALNALRCGEVGQRVMDRYQARWLRWIFSPAWRTAARAEAVAAELKVLAWLDHAHNKDAHLRAA
jgi:hypothetical protein